MRTRLRPSKASGRVLRLGQFLAAMALLQSGCGALNEYKIDSRNHLLARRAWNCLEDVYRDVEYPYDFGRGFRAGYFNVAGGGNGCPPVLPPRKYWTVNLVNPLGHRRTHAWFEGFKYGAMVAEQDGVGVWITLPTGHPEPPPPIDIAEMLEAAKQATKTPAIEPSDEGRGPAEAPAAEETKAAPKSEPPPPAAKGTDSPRAAPSAPEASTEPKAAIPQADAPREKAAKGKAGKGEATKAPPDAPVREIPVEIPDEPGNGRNLP